MEPGKIPHEIRHGELAQLRILPFQPYYGTHDATSLFVIVISYLYHWLGDVALLQPLPAQRRRGDALDRPTRATSTATASRSTGPARRHGYYNQGWKDAGDAILHADGSLASLPIALCELQGYVYDAKLRLADIYEILGRERKTRSTRAQAARAVRAVQRGVLVGGRGHLLPRPRRREAADRDAWRRTPGTAWRAGIVPPERASRVVARLMAPDLWSGWGIRTLSSDHVAYNPFSYHTGSVWPHDNALIAGGFRRYGHDAEAARIARGLFDATERFEANRLPELFAGLPRDDDSFPVQYLGANVPQAWAAGSIIQLDRGPVRDPRHVGPDRLARSTSIRRCPIGCPS